MAFHTAVPTNNVLVWIRTLVLLWTFFLDILTITFPCLPFLPPLPKLSTSIGSEVILELVSAGFDVGLDFASNLFVRDQSCTVHGKMLFQLTRHRNFKCSCLDVIIQTVVVLPLDSFLIGGPVLPISRFLRVGLATSIDLETRFVV